MSRIDIGGQRFGRLAVLGLSHVDKHCYWRCVCDCGVEKVICGRDLRAGTSKSCGCLQRELLSERVRTWTTKHGMTHTSEYRSWADMVQRCHNSKDTGYKDYGARGIQVCDLWRFGDPDKSGFEHRLEYIRTNLPPKPSPTHTVDRIDNDGNYEPGNIRWATKREQILNRRAHSADARANMSEGRRRAFSNPEYRTTALNNRRWSRAWRIATKIADMALFYCALVQAMIQNRSQPTHP